MSQWRTVRMRDLMTEFHDGPHATPAPADVGPIFLGIKNIAENGLLDLTSTRHISESDYAKWTRRVVPQSGDVVFTYEATLHRYAVIPAGFRGCLGRRLALVRPNQDVVLSRFLHFAFLGPAWRATVMNRILAGSTVDRLPIASFPDFPISIPDLDTQRRVVETLGSIDDLIENNRRRIELLEQMARVVYRKWFVRFAPSGRNTSRQGQGGVPDGWKFATASDLVRSNILDIGDGFRAKNSEMTKSDRGLPFLRVSNLHDGHMSPTQCDQLPLTHPVGSTPKVSRPGDSVISTKGTVGRSLYIDERYPSVVYSPQISYWRSLDHSVLAPSYLYLWICSDDFTRQCAAVKGATDMAEYVNLKDQRSMSVLVPDPSAIERFDSIASVLLRQLGTLRFEIDKLSAIRHLLLPRLVSGDIDVSKLDLDEVVESVA